VTPYFLNTTDQESLRNVPTVLLLVGERRTPFHIHQSLLFAASHFFTANLTTGFAQTTTYTIAIPEEDADTVEPFVH
jgi:BTB/POZ domain